MDSDLDFSPVESVLNQVNVNEVARMVEDENMPPYQFRNKFREVVLIYFNQTNKRSGSYETSEQMAKEYFERYYDIPQNAWNFRNRKPV